jgi:hypothetical protein
LAISNQLLELMNSKYFWRANMEKEVIFIFNRF